MLFDLGSKVNAIHLTFAKELELHIRLSNIRTKKIDSIMLDTYEMVVTVLSMTDKINQVKFFEKNFLVANVSLEIVFKMLFLTLSGANIDFLDWKLR